MSVQRLVRQAVAEVEAVEAEHRKRMDADARQRDEKIDDHARWRAQVDARLDAIEARLTMLEGRP